MENKFEMNDIPVELEQPAETAEQPAENGIQLPEYEDFYLTPTVIDSLKGIMMWAKILIGCTLFFGLAELLLGAGSYMALRDGFILSVFLSVVRSILAICCNGIIVWMGLKFVANMSSALKYSNGSALEIAFWYQSRYFKWVFINIVVTIGGYLLTRLLYP